MRLKHVQITNFKCIKDSDTFTVDPDVTCLVGKNESGKTAVLQALEKLRPLSGERGAFTELEFPRAQLSEFKESDVKHHAIKATWELDEEDIEAICEVVGENVCKSKQVTVTHGYYDSTAFNIDIDEPRALKNLLDRHELFAEEREPLETLADMEEVLKALQSKAANPEQKKPDTLSPREATLLKDIQSRFPRFNVGPAWSTVVEIIKDRTPRFVYFSEYHRMPGQVSLNDLKSRIASKNLRKKDEVFLALLSLIGRDPEELEGLDTEPLPVNWARIGAS